MGILVLMVVENIFPPIPSEIIMPLAGYMVTKGELIMVGVLLAGTTGTVLGALPLYYLGHKLGEKRLKKFADKHGRWLALSSKDIESSKRWFDRHGPATVMFCRLVPGIRSLISIPAGLAKMPFWLFLAYTSVGAGIWTALLAYLGYFLGGNFKQVAEYLGPVSWFVFGAIAVGYAYRVVRHH
jgi:membrane protein DedA with SNARE-associated domain